MGIGTYVAHRTFNNRRYDDLAILRFKIEKDDITRTRIIQELPHKQVAIVTPMEVSIYQGTLDDFKHILEIWSPFRAPVDPSDTDGQLNGVVGVEWRRTSKQRLMRCEVDAEAVRGNLEAVLGDAIFALQERNDRWFDGALDMRAVDAIWEKTGFREEAENPTRELWALFQPAPEDIVQCFRDLRTWLRSVEVMDPTYPPFTIPAEGQDVATLKDICQAWVTKVAFLGADSIRHNQRLFDLRVPSQSPRVYGGRNSHEGFCHHAPVVFPSPKEHVFDRVDTLEMGDHAGRTI